MELLTAEQLKNLKWGDKVYRLLNNQIRQLQFVAVMPSSKNYLIFSDGEYLTYLHISSKDNSFFGDWYVGEYDSETFGNKLLEQANKNIENIKATYF
jgi:hypothetical protein